MQITDSLIDNIANQGHNKGELTPYLLFKYAIKTEITRKYYERRLKKFFDFILSRKDNIKQIKFLINTINMRQKDLFYSILFQKMVPKIRSN